VVSLDNPTTTMEELFLDIVQDDRPGQRPSSPANS
jgi:hypothetical protein